MFKVKIISRRGILFLLFCFIDDCCHGFWFAQKAANTFWRFWVGRCSTSSYVGCSFILFYRFVSESKLYETFKNVTSGIQFDNKK